MNETRDREIFEAMLKNDNRAYSEFIESYKNLVFKTCYTFLKNKEDAEDIAQEVFIEVFRSIKKFRFESQVSTWLYRISINRSLNYLKKKKVKRWFSDFKSIFDNDSDVLSINAPDNTESKVHERELNERFEKELSKLSYKQRIAFTLNKVQGLSNSETAKVMGISINSADVLIYKAKKNLQQKMKFLKYNE